MLSRKAIAFTPLAATLLTLAACQQGDAPAPQDSASASDMTMAPDAKPGTSANAGGLVLPVVAGRPAGVYFSFTNQSGEPVELAAVHIDGAGSAEMHKTEGGVMSAVKTIPVAAGATVRFEPGALHVMAFDLADSLKAGETTEMTLTFGDGDKLSIPLAIEKMGAGMNGSGMNGSGTGGMDHGSMGHMDH